MILTASRRSRSPKPRRPQKSSSWTKSWNPKPNSKPTTRSSRISRTPSTSRPRGSKQKLSPPKLSPPKKPAPKNSRAKSPRTKRSRPRWPAKPPKPKNFSKSTRASGRPSARTAAGRPGQYGSLRASVVHRNAAFHGRQAHLAQEAAGVARPRLQGRAFCPGPRRPQGALPVPAPRHRAHGDRERLAASHQAGPRGPGQEARQDPDSAPFERRDGNPGHHRLPPAGHERRDR